MSSDDGTDEIEGAAREAAKGDPAADVRRWLLEAKSATLCTLSAKGGLEGWPFGSIVPFALTARGEPVVLIARIAAHTANLRKDARASLFVHEPHREGDPQAGWRATLLGRMEKLVPASEAARELMPYERATPDDELAEIHARYRERVPASDGYLETHGFDFWRLSGLEKVRYIAGFGSITWLEGDAVLRDPLGAGVLEVAPGAVQHMNEDHGQNLVEMCAGLYGFAPEEARMVSLDRAGFLVETRAPERLLWFSFGREITGDEVRGAVIDVLKRARAQRG